MEKKSYPDDLTDQERELIKDLVTYQNNLRERKGKYAKCVIRFFICFDRDAAGGYCPTIFLLGNRSMLNSANGNEKGIFMKIYEYLRKKLRKGLGHNVYTSTGIIDSQSVNTTEKGKDYDGGKTTKRIYENQGQSFRNCAEA